MKADGCLAWKNSFVYVLQYELGIYVNEAGYYINKLHHRKHKTDMLMLSVNQNPQHKNK